MSIRTYLQKIPLTPKMLLLTALVGLGIWGLLDHIQSRKLRAIFYAQQLERLNREARDSRVHFDTYIASYYQAAQLFVSLKQFSDYLYRPSWRAGPATSPVYHSDIPPWLPDASVLRKFARVPIALLLDGQQRVREIYLATSDRPPPSLVNPSSLLQSLSAHQSFMTSFDGFPYVVTAEPILGADGQARATLLFASPLDDDFLVASQGLAYSHGLVALVSAGEQRVVSSTSPDLLPPGVAIDTLKDRFIVIGKSFFDHGASDLQIQFTVLIPKAEYENLSTAILAANRKQYAISALVFITAFAVIVFRITRHIRALSRDINAFSGQVLGAPATAMPTGDELHVLEARFKHLVEEIEFSRNALLRDNELLEQAHRDLAHQTELIDSNRNKLQKALDEISAYIQQVAVRKDYQVRFTNQALKKCYEMLSCTNEKCACHGREAMRCWQIAGTYCLMNCPPGGSFALAKYSDCVECPVFREATTDPANRIGEYFNNMMHILELKHEELSTAYRELKAAQSQILQREKMASVGQLAAGVAHEINNPMGYIISNLGSLGKYVTRMTEFIRAQDGIIEALDDPTIRNRVAGHRKALKIDRIMEDAVALLAESLEGADRVKKIVLNLKGFSRLDDTEPVMADLNAGLESTINIIWNELKYKATVSKDFGKLPPTRCNPGELNQVFMNLLINAAQAIDKQGAVVVKTWAEAGSIFVSVADTGCGIPADKLDRIFEPFFTTKEVGQGTGLGLSIVYDIVKKHQGEILVTSQEGQGTTFTVRIPVVEK